MIRNKLELASVTSMQRLAQVKAYTSVIVDSHHPPRWDMCDAKGTRLIRGCSWITQTLTTFVVIVIENMVILKEIEELAGLNISERIINNLK